MTAPKLRFKEFDGDWSLKTINNIASKVGSGSTPRGGAEAYIDEGIIFIRSQNVNNNQLLLDDVVFIPESTHEKMSGSKVLPNDILLNITGASIGRSCIVPDNFVEGNVNQHVCIIRTPNDDPVFVQSFLSSKKGQNHIQSKQVGGGREGLNFQAIRSIDFEMPSKEEQTKIASFLSTVDEKINQLNQKHSLLSQYKQGMMQKLFSQQIRFKADDGSEFGEWGNSYIGDVCKITTGNKDTQNKVDDGEYPFFVRSQTVERINSYSMDCEAVLTSGDGVGVGKNYHYIDGKFDFHQRVYCLFDFSENILGKYLYIYFSSYFYDRVKRLSAKNSVDSVRMDMISKMEIQLPCLEEQTKIANFLSAIDQKIEVVAQQIEQAKTWKKGLLQQMFV